MNKKKVWMIAVSGTLAAAVIVGALMISRKPAPIAVFPWDTVGYTDFFMNGGESSGLVATDKVQTLFVSETQKVTQILVQEGQQVKEGDVLITYDTTLSDLALQRKDLEIQQNEVTLDNAKAELDQLNAMRPMVVAPPPETKPNPEKVDHTKSPADPLKLGTVYDGNGKSAKTPFYFWLGQGAQIDDGMIAYLMEQAGNPEALYVVFQIAPEDKPNTPFQYENGLKFVKIGNVVPSAPTPTEPSNPIDPLPSESRYRVAPAADTEPSESTAPSETTEPADTAAPSETTEPADTTAPSETTEPADTTAPSETTEPADTAAPSETTEPADTTVPSETTEPADTTAPSETTEPADTTAPSETTEPTVAPEPEQPNAPAETRFTYAMSFFVPGMEEEIEQGPDIDWNSGYTEEELRSLRREKAAQIKQLETDIKMGKAELNIMKKEAADDKVCAKFDGIVTSVLEADSAVASQQPIVKVNGGGGFYVEGSVGELDLNTIQVGQKVSVNSWENGQTYEGEIVQIGQYPSTEQNYFGPSAVNQTYYPYRVFIDESADLMEGAYVGLTYKTELAQGGSLKVQNAFIRQDGNQSYVYVRNEQGVLEKRQIQVGASDGFYTPVYSGVTEADLFAFPYGKDVREGAPTFEGSDQDLYGG